MSTTTRLIHATPEQVWDVLSDGWLYPLWVVGASRMRDVDEHWPEVGAKLHHSVGTWPLLIDDNTEVMRIQPPSLLELKARGWPAGTARVRLHLEAVGTETQVTIEEDVEDGPGRLVPKPVRDVQLGWRNVESLRRLAYVAEGRVAT
ncbi:SRPBCC family protein [Nocardioides marmotae]|uniref:SRPBCC family protein n=1 Tax=Nocardioides marmotae TaxID=2663857 RepID=A0A6I3JFW2_9ACTN|nr:SRPBCC family protein [Nocardioides marmotae]MCR6033268.1 SRPBCC family protein [Gordonia jinghuaiqii]MBC9734777.1 SRPBCC family protein [Nocardioides marmotae]MTB85878.1 SRPBCC family protein [Nocardioides marmotae]MTB96925.1 SRPBCC family protein [Nocardioides marmotae]QKE00690.1 SRPBCC family protein [Nocardioides marmotae]